VHARWRTASREELIAELERQQQEIARQQREIERLRRDQDRAGKARNRYRRERDVLRKKIERLEDDLDAARRAAHRQAAPFSRGLPRRRPRPPGRRAGRAYGRRAHRAIPPRIDKTYQAPLPAACPHCGATVRLMRHAMQYQEDLPRIQPIVRAFTIAIGQCTACHRRVQGRHPLQTSNALGAAAAQLGPQAVTVAAVLNKQLGLPLGKISALFRERFGLHVTAGGLVHALHRTARQAGPTYASLCETVRGSPVVSPDETGWKVGGHPYWLWAGVTPDTTVYAIQRGRGFEEAARLLGAEFDGVLVRDGWVAYRPFDRAVHQTCLAHLLRRCRDLVRDHGDHRFAPAVAAILRRGLRVRDRWRAGKISTHGVAVARGHLFNRLNALIDRPGPARVAQKFAAHLAIEGPAAFTFLFDPTIDATNWRAEQALRPAVVTRKVSGGNRTARGARTQEVLASVLRTIQQRQLDAGSVFHSLLCAPQPRVVLAPSPTAR
jgi:transposase